MTIHNKPNYSSLGVWASDGNIVQPDSDKIEEGHVVEKPKNEYMNWIQNRQDEGIAYLLQKGVATWDNFTEYPINAFVDFNGRIYKALNQNTDKQPNTSPDNWVLAFADSQLVDEVEKIKTVDGYLDQYVSKSSPVMYGRAMGAGFAAIMGTATNSGYSFNGSDNSGMHFENDRLVFRVNGEVTGTMNSDDVQEEKTLITRKELNDAVNFVLGQTQIKVGDLYLSTDPTYPFDKLGYGAWEKYAQGLALVGHSADVSSNTPDWAKVGGAVFGTYTHQLTRAELPRTRLDLRESSDASGFGNGAVTGSTADGWTNGVVSEFGEDRPHNNVQPSITIYVWKRTA